MTINSLPLDVGAFVSRRRLSGNEVGTAYKKFMSPQRRYRAELNQLKKAYDATGRSDTALREKISAAVRTLRQARKNISAYARTWDTLNAKARQTGNTLKKIGQNSRLGSVIRVGASKHIINNKAHEVLARLGIVSGYAAGSRERREYLRGAISAEMTRRHSAWDNFTSSPFVKTGFIRESASLGHTRNKIRSFVNDAKSLYQISEHQGNSSLRPALEALNVAGSFESLNNRAIRKLPAQQSNTVSVTINATTSTADDISDAVESAIRRSLSDNDTAAAGVQ